MLILLRFTKEEGKTHQGQIRKNSYVRVSPAQQNHQEEIVISFDSQKQM
jgi:peptide methionine sulfoxide reductase MsrA